MKHLFLISIFLCFHLNIYSQSFVLRSEYLSKVAIDTVFGDSVRAKLNIKYPILNVIKYADKSGQHYTVFSESKGNYKIEKDSVNYLITATNFIEKRDTLFETWSTGDSILRDFSVGVQDLHFNFDLINFSDCDSDGIIDPVMVFSTLSHYYFLIFHEGLKINIDLLYNRSERRKLLVDEAFYELPEMLQACVRDKMNELYESNPPGFPQNWQTSMDRFKTHIENKARSPVKK